MRTLKHIFAGSTSMLILVACGNNAALPTSAQYGASPELPAQHQEFIPTQKTPSTVGWKNGETPKPASGLKVNAFATGLKHPRWLYVLPNGDVLVAESDHGTQAADTMGYGGWVESLVRRIEGQFTESANRITLLRDADGDGVAETRTVLISGLNAPFGMTLVGDTLYVADTDALLAFPYRKGETHIAEAGRKITDLPAGDIDHHWTKNVIASKDGSKLYVSIGSNSNAGENGLAAEQGRADIWEVDLRTGSHRVFASGLRNPNGMGWAPDGALWTAVNERDELGGDLVPDYMTSVKDGGFYGWPYSYYGQNIDLRVSPQNPAMVAKAIVPDYALGAHTASLGLAFADGAKLGSFYTSGVFIGQHGSWNRKPVSGYRVVFITFADGHPSGQPTEVLTGFLNGDGDVRGRPVDVAIGATGTLLVTDDAGNVVWRVSKSD
ncbi:MAG TPA: sorbosone dehydrogenase family protein [Rhizomicrobium sp.]|jgi:glucose/arabinose dehydrogenase|nr:sorbosone dehydrogenase family protein [Rhizomicrobium sp.]